MNSSTHLKLVSLQVSDIEASLDFYTKILNFEPSADLPPESIVFNCQDGASFVIRKAVTEFDIANRPESGIAIWFTMRDLIDFRDKNIDQITIIRDIHPTPFGNVLVIADPDGYFITLNDNNIAES